MNVPESKVEVRGFEARHYDTLLKLLSFGAYPRMVKAAIAAMGIQPDDAILDLGCGTGYNDCLMVEYLGDKGRLVGLDIGDEMIAQFEARCRDKPQVQLMKRRIEEPLPFEEAFDKVFISFVFHGFPDSEREKIARNAFKALKPGGAFFIFDFNEFDVADQPWWIRTAFLKGECPLAHQFVTVDWKARLETWGFTAFEEWLYFRDLVRLLKAVKPA